MRPRTSSFSSRLAVAPLLLLAACSGGGGGTSVGARALNCTSPGGGNALCLVSCNLGCSRTGCTVSDIAVNQTIALYFNQNIDPASVNGGSVALRTSGGRVPVGELVVQGNAVLFVPDIRIQGNTLAFGFENGAQYILSLPGGTDEPQTIRSTSGDKLSQSLNCFLNVSRGVQDLDGKPPTANLVAPTPDAAGRVSTVASYVVEFSELLDTIPFQGANLSNGPVTMSVYRSRNVNGQLVCDTTPYLVPGSLQVSTNRLTQRTSVTLTPSVVLPGNVCVAVEVTSLARDLSGKPASRNVFRVVTEDVPPQAVEINEDFRAADRMDPVASGAHWENGALRPAAIGSDGRHGQFVAADGTFVGTIGGYKTYTWNTLNQNIRADRNHLNQAAVVNDGVFYFSSFVVEADERIQFRSTDNRPVQIYVRGQAVINGIVDVNGDATANDFNGAQAGSASGTRQGQAGARGGPGANNGGAGGAVPGLAGFQVNGYPGTDVRVALGSNHPYFPSATGTGGRGSDAMPPNGDVLQVAYCFSSGFFSRQMPAGGAGGSLFDQQLGLGGAASVIPTGCTASIFGPPSIPGTAMQLLPTIAPYTSRELFMVGGSGGGGAGVNPYNSIRGQVVAWKPGGGGGGGGGVLMIGTGGGIRTAAAARIEAKGGAAGNPINIGFAAPGGGGSGGSLLLQTSGNTLILGGTCDVSGGNGGLWQGAVAGDPRSQGGRGGSGYVRIEAPTAPPVAQLGVIAPVAASALN